MRWAGSAQVYEDYGTRNLPELLSLADAIAFRERLDIARCSQQLLARREALRARVEAHPDLEWRSPRATELGGSLFAIHVRNKPAPGLGESLWQQHKIVVRAFGGELDTLRISPNLQTTQSELDRLFTALGAD